ncbi:MAG TPA: segregation/condensation protein A [Stenomitos sp.]
MSHTFADDAISLLIDLAQRGEIDPWDVNVVEVFDRVLSELSLSDAQDLATSGQVFLYASMLVLLKAESLAGLDRVEEEEFPLDDGVFLDDFEPLNSGRLPSNLEHCLQRRPVALPFPRRKVTLPELIQQLELIAVAVERQSRLGQTHKKKITRPTRAQSIKAIAQLSHAENLSEVAAELERILSESGLAQEWMTFETLLQLKNDRVGVFWALLLLSAQSKIELDQQEFYQDLQFRPLVPETRVELPVFSSLNSAAS